MFQHDEQRLDILKYETERERQGYEREAERIGGGNPLFSHSSRKRNERLNPLGLRFVFSSLSACILVFNFFFLLHLIFAFLMALLGFCFF